MQLAKPESEDEVVSTGQYLMEVDNLMREAIRLYKAKRRKSEIQFEDLIQ